ncbi:MAG: integrase family protein [Desulfuromonadales bacterium]|nr:integrase family protein [Desulfuromonadales bacterium]
MPVKIRLSQKRVADLEPVPGKQVEVWDTDQPRFGVRVSPGGRKVFFVMRRVDGKLVRATVGIFPEMNVDTARTRAAALLVAMQDGHNPNLEKKHRRELQDDQRGILLHLFESYLDSGGMEGKVKGSTKVAYRSAFKRLKAWHGLPVENISADMVKRLHAEIGKSAGGYAANFSIALLRSLMKYSMENYNRPAVNPTSTVKWFKEIPRREAMPPETIPAFFKALDELKGDNGADLFRVLLFTGMRKGEAMPLKWSDVDLENKSLHVQDTKGGTSLDIPISGHLAEILLKRKERVKSPWIFRSNSRVGHVTNTAQYCREIEALGVRVYPHLLRKTFTTIAASIVPGAMVDCLTGHIPQDVTGRHYTFPSVGQLRPHTEAVTAAILEMAGALTNQSN